MGEIKIDSAGLWQAARGRPRGAAAIKLSVNIAIKLSVNIADFARALASLCGAAHSYSPTHSYPPTHSYLPQAIYYIIYIIRTPQAAGRRGRGPG